MRKFRTMWTVLDVFQNQLFPVRKHVIVNSCLDCILELTIISKCLFNDFFVIASFLLWNHFRRKEWLLSVYSFFFKWIREKKSKKCTYKYKLMFAKITNFLKIRINQHLLIFIGNLRTFETIYVVPRLMGQKMTF